MNIELEFEKRLKEELNYKIDYLQGVIMDDLAGIDLMLSNIGVKDDVLNEVIEKFNKINSHLNHEKIK